MEQRSEKTITDLKTSAPVTPHRKRLGAAYIWLLLFMVIYCARPEDWIPGLGHLHLAKITGGLTILALLLALGRQRRHLPREVIYLVLLIVELWISAALSPVWRGGALQEMLEFSKVLLIVLVIALVVDSIRKLRWLIFAQAASVATIAAVTIWKGHHLVGRLRGVLNGNYSDPNDLAFAIAISAPLCLYFLFRARSRSGKLIWAVAILVMIYGVLSTASRGGLISLGAAAVVCLWEFGVRRRRRALLVVTLVAGIAFWGYAGQGIRLRFDSGANTFGARQQAAYGSATQRWDLLVQSLHVTARHPLFGIGPGNFPVVSGNWHVTHNSYTQISAEGGLIALVLYLLILGRGVRNLAAVKRLTRSGAEADMLACALSATLVAYAVGSFFLSEAYQLFPYFFVAYTSALFGIAAHDLNRDHSQEHGRTTAEVNQSPALEAPELDEIPNDWVAGEQVWPSY